MISTSRQRALGRLWIGVLIGFIALGFLLASCDSSQDKEQATDARQEAVNLAKQNLARQLGAPLESITVGSVQETFFGTPAAGRQSEPTPTPIPGWLITLRSGGLDYRYLATREAGGMEVTLIGAVQPETPTSTETPVPKETPEPMESTPPAPSTESSPTPSTEATAGTSRSVEPASTPEAGIPPLEPQPTKEAPTQDAGIPLMPTLPSRDDTRPGGEG